MVVYLHCASSRRSSTDSHGIHDQAILKEREVVVVVVAVGIVADGMIGAFGPNVAAICYCYRSLLAVSNCDSRLHGRDG
jgi:hypothetical protein